MTDLEDELIHTYFRLYFRCLGLRIAKEFAADPHTVIRLLDSLDGAIADCEAYFKELAEKGKNPVDTPAGV